jgi:hypothetical protein
MSLVALKSAATRSYIDTVCFLASAVIAASAIAGLMH